MVNSSDYDFGYAQSYNQSPFQGLFTTKYFKILLSFIVLIILIFIASKLLGLYVFDGRLIVNTNPKSDQISVYKIGAGANISTETHYQPSSGSTSRLNSGVYMVSVKSNKGLVEEEINIHARQLQIINVLVPSTKTIEPVSSIDTNSYSVTPFNLSLLDVSSGNILTIDNQNNLNTLAGGVSFSAVKWYASNLGIGETSSGNFYLVSPQGEKAIQLPSYIAGGWRNYSVAPSGDLYLAVGTHIYKWNSVKGLSSVYVANSSLATLYASNNNLAVVIVNNDTLHVSILANNKVVAKGQFTAYSLNWSPGGNYLFVSGASISEVLTPSLQVVSILPQTNIGTATWISDTRLIYSQNMQLWQYDLSNNQSALLTTSSTSIQTVAANSDSSYVYFSVVGNRTNPPSSYLVRVPLNNQPISPLAVKLSAYLPSVFGYCEVSYLNFTQPALLVRSFLTPMPPTCNNATDFLTQDGINTSTTPTQFNNIPVTGE